MGFRRLRSPSQPGGRTSQIACVADEYAAGLQPGRAVGSLAPRRGSSKAGGRGRLVLETHVLVSVVAQYRDGLGFAQLVVLAIHAVVRPELSVLEMEPPLRVGLGRYRSDLELPGAHHRHVLGTVRFFCQLLAKVGLDDYHPTGLSGR